MVRCLSRSSGGTHMSENYIYTCLFCLRRDVDLIQNKKKNTHLGLKFRKVLKNYSLLTILF